MILAIFLKERRETQERLSDPDRLTVEERAALLQKEVEEVASAKLAAQEREAGIVEAALMWKEELHTRTVEKARVVFREKMRRAKEVRVAVVLPLTLSQYIL